MRSLFKLKWDGWRPAREERRKREEKEEGKEFGPVVPKSYDYKCDIRTKKDRIEKQSQLWDVQAGLPPGAEIAVWRDEPARPSKHKYRESGVVCAV